MRFLQHAQITGEQEPPKSQTRRLKFSYELARQLWKREWDYFQVLLEEWDEATQRWKEPFWDEWMAANPVTATDIARANRILSEHEITLSVQPPKGKTVGRTPPIRAIRQEKLGDISEEDCLAEGIRVVDAVSITVCPGAHATMYECPLCEKRFEKPGGAYRCLWNHCGDWEEDKDKQVFVLDWRER